MDFPGVCDKCPLGLVCATNTAYEEKNLCHCQDCRQVMMVFVEIGRESLRKQFVKASRRAGKSKVVRNITMSKHLFNMFYTQNSGDMLIGLLDGFECPHPYTGPDYLCPACAMERRRKEIEGDD